MSDVTVTIDSENPLALFRTARLRIVGGSVVLWMPGPP